MPSQPYRNCWRHTATNSGPTMRRAWSSWPCSTSSCSTGTPLRRNSRTTSLPIQTAVCLTNCFLASNFSGARGTPWPDVRPRSCHARRRHLRTLPARQRRPRPHHDRTGTHRGQRPRFRLRYGRSTVQLRLRKVRPRERNTDDCRLDSRRGYRPGVGRTRRGRQPRRGRYRDAKPRFSDISARPGDGHHRGHQRGARQRLHAQGGALHHRQPHTAHRLSCRTDAARGRNGKDGRT